MDGTETTKRQVHCVTVMVIDLDDLGFDGVAVAIENARYPNYCLIQQVMGVVSKTVEWHDQHPLNIRGQCVSTFREMFLLDDWRKGKMPASNALTFSNERKLKWKLA